MANDLFFVDGKHVTAEECRKLFSDGAIEDRQQRCLELAEGNVLVDIGCYAGTFVDALARVNPDKQVVGIDYDPEHIKIARFLYPQRAFMQSSVYQLALADSSVDCVTFQEVIEHLEGAAAAVKEINRILKPGGTLIVTTPHPYYWRDMAIFLLREIKNRLRGQSRLVPLIYFENVEWNRHVYCWTPATILTLLSSNGFEYLEHHFSSGTSTRLESIVLRLFPFLGSVQIMKVRKIGNASRKTI